MPSGPSGSNPTAPQGYPNYGYPQPAAYPAGYGAPGMYPVAQPMGYNTITSGPAPVQQVPPAQGSPGGPGQQQRSTVPASPAQSQLNSAGYQRSQETLAEARDHYMHSRGGNR